MSAESSLGAYLRDRRERSALSLDAVSSGSRIAAHLLRALEDDCFDVLPAPVYVRGFIRAYCAQVGVDPDAALRRYEAHLASTPAPSLRHPLPTADLPPPARRWRRAAAAAALLVGLGVAVTVLVVRGRQFDAAASRGPTPRVAQSPALAVPAAPVGPADRVGVSGPGTPAPTPAPGEHVLLVRAIDTTWVRVATEGGPSTEETLPSGTAREWRSAGSFRVSVGDAGGVEVELDGRALPALGHRGEVVHTTIPGEARP